MSLLHPPLAWTGILDAKIPEVDLQRAAVALLRAVGWRVFVDRMAFRSDKGWLDVYAVHREMRRTIYVEFKTQTGKIRPEQQDWIDLHHAVGHEVRVVRPGDWESFARWIMPPRMLTDPFRQSMAVALARSNGRTKRQQHEGESA